MSQGWRRSRFRNPAGDFGRTNLVALARAKSKSKFFCVKHAVTALPLPGSFDEDDDEDEDPDWDAREVSRQSLEDMLRESLKLVISSSEEGPRKSRRVNHLNKIVQIWNKKASLPIDDVVDHQEALQLQDIFLW